MAFLQELRMKCNHYSCSKLAIVQAWDNRNKATGYYCRKHGKERLAVLLREVD